MILVVDNDRQVRDVICAGLVDEGFYAIPTSTPEMALAIFASTPGSFEAVVTDVDFPAGLNGWDMAEEIRKIRTDLPVVYVAGGGARLCYELRSFRRTLWLAKPFDLSALVAALRAFLLGSCPSASASREAYPVNDA